MKTQWRLRMAPLVAASGFWAAATTFPAMAASPVDAGSGTTMGTTLPSPSPGATFVALEEAATPAYIARTARNRAAFLDFVRLYYGERKVREAFDRYVAADYQQHNPHIADGREAAVAWLLKMTTGSTVRMEIRRITVDGDYAVVHLHASQGPDDRGHVIMNLFRLQDGIIMEHWDVTQAVPATTASGRPLG